MAETPEFIRWTIELACPLRHQDAWQSPEATQRQLRGIRAYSECRVAGRVLDNICVSHPPTMRDADRATVTGFRAAEVFTFFGGQAYVESQCIGCPANVMARQDARHLAGCFGLFEWSDIRTELLVAVDLAIEATGQAARFRDKFPATSPTWYGLWINSPLDDEQADLLMAMFSRIPSELPRRHAPLAEFIQAIAVSCEQRLPLRVSYFPFGDATDRHWTMSAHCHVCKARMQTTDRSCQVCGRSGGPQPVRIRHLQGSRPYRPLNDFLSPDQIDTFLNRHFES